MSRARTGLQGLAIGTLLGLAAAGCGNSASPVSPSHLQSPAASTAGPSPASLGQRTAGGISTLGSHAQDKYVVCYEGTGAYTQISIVAWGMPGAVQRCLNDLNGRVAGVISAPAP